MIRKVVVLGLLVALFGCSRVPITNRAQLNLIPETELIKTSEKSYMEFIRSNKLVTKGKDAALVKNVGNKIAKSVEHYLKNHGKSKRLAGFSWQFNLVQNKQVNAWCMPGGKVVFYTGILPFTKDELGMAVVMGHEIAHAIARHGNERMSQQLAIQTGGQSISQVAGANPGLTSKLFNGAYGLGTTLGALAFSRKHEAEADRMGLVFMAMAGYDPREAPKFWKRMAAGGGKKPPAILSTHPHDQKRIESLEKHMAEAMKYYNKRKK